MPPRPILFALALLAIAPAGAAAGPLTICASAPLAGLDPARHIEQDAVPLGPAQIFDTLVGIGADGAIEPRLARWWDISKNGLEFRFKLRPGVAFHATGDFTPSRDLSAADVVFTFRRQIDPEHALAPAAPLAADMVGLASILERVEALPDGEVSFRLRAPHAGFLALLSMGFAGIQSAEYADFAAAREEPGLLDSAPVGTGPFRFAGRDGDRVLLKANGAYWDGAPKADEIVIAPLPSAARRYAGVRRGGCDIALSPEAADLDDLAADPGVAVETLPRRSVVYVAFNTQRKPLDDRWVRRALGEALDRAKLAAAAPKGAVPASRLVALAGGAAERGVPAGDPGLAAAHLAALGTAEAALSLTLVTPYAGAAPPRDPDPVAGLIAETWRGLGIEVHVSQVRWDGYLESLKAGEHQAAIVAFAPDVPDEEVALETLLSCAAVGTSNLSHWCYPPFEALLQTARAAVDPVQRDQALAAAETMIAERAPVLALFRPAVPVAVRRAVRGFSPEALARGDLTGLSLAVEEK